MTNSWDDTYFDVTNLDLGLLMSDCPAELSIQSHGLMLDVRRSIQLSRSREGTSSPWTQFPSAGEVAVLRRVKSFQQPAVSTSIGPSLSRIRSFFDFSREDTLALVCEVSDILPQSENFCAQGDGGAEEDGNQKAERMDEVSASSDVKPTLSDAAEPHLNNDVKRIAAVDDDGGGFEKPGTGAAGVAKVDVSETIKKIESALEDALHVGSLKLDVRERIRRLQTAFGGFIAWDSSARKPKGELSDAKPVDRVGSENPAKLAPSQSDVGNELEQGSNLIKGIEGELRDSVIGEEIQENRVDSAVENPSPPQTAGAIDELQEKRVIEVMEDGGFCFLNRVKEIALNTEQAVSSRESDAFSEEMDGEIGLDEVDEVDEVQAVVLDFDTIIPMVAVRDAFSELQDVRVENDTIEEGPEEGCDRVTTVDSSCNVLTGSKSVGIQCNAIDELQQGTVIPDAEEETSQCSDRFDGHAPVVDTVEDDLGELNRTVEEANEKGVQDSAEVEKVQADFCWDITAREKSESLRSDDIVNVGSSISPRGGVLPLQHDLGTLNVFEQEMAVNDVCDKGPKDLNGVDDGARPNVLWDSVSDVPLATQITASRSELKEERVVKEMDESGLRKLNVEVDEVQPETGGGEPVLSEKEGTDISSLPSPLSQLLDYRNGSAFTFLNVQDFSPDVGDCLLHDEEKIWHVQPGCLSPETSLKTLLAPGEPWDSQEEQASQNSGMKTSDTGRSKVVVSLRRLHIRKSVRPSALKASSPKAVFESVDDNTLTLHSSSSSQTARDLHEDDVLVQSHSRKKPVNEDWPLESNSPIHSVVRRAPLNEGQNPGHNAATGDMNMKSRAVREAPLEKHRMHEGSLLHVNRTPATPASPKRLGVGERRKNLSEKHRPTRFGDLVGQTTVVKSLTTCISRQRIAPLYLFLGPRGTGKTSAARVFAAGLNCLSAEPKIRPCGSCRECRAVALDVSPNVQIVDAATVRDSSRMKAAVKHSASLVGHTAIIVKECDSLSLEIWTALLDVMEEPPSNVVLILLSTTANRIPLQAISRCKKLHFYNVSDDEVVDRLQALAHQEDLEVEEGALLLIASKSNGSVHDAEIALDQLSVADKKVSLASVQKHVGLLPDCKLLNLLDSALSADTTNTTKMMNEILGSSVEPLLLVSQLGILITNILVENFDVHREKRKSKYSSFASKQMQRRLRQALKILSEAEKYVRVSTDSLTWLTAALLQCASDRPFAPSVVGSLAQTPMIPTTRGQRLEMLVSTEVGAVENEPHPTHVSQPNPSFPTQVAQPAAEKAPEGDGGRTPKLSEPSSSLVEPSVENSPGRSESLGFHEAWTRESEQPDSHIIQVGEKCAPNAHEAPVAGSIHVLEERDSIELWNRVLNALTSRNLKHLLLTQGRLVSAGVASDGSRAIVEVEFQYAADKHKAERSWRSICSAFQAVLSTPIEIRISLRKNVFDEGQLPRPMGDMDDEERQTLTQHMSRLKQEAEVASYSTDSHCRSHSKRRRRRARRGWQPAETVEPERESRPRSDTGSAVPEPMLPLTPRSKAGERVTSATPLGGHAHEVESSFSESVEQHSGSLDTIQSRLLIGGTARRPRLRTMLDTALTESAENQDTDSTNSLRPAPTAFRTDHGLPLEAFCFPCTQRMSLFRREPTHDVEQPDGRRERDSGPMQMDGRGRAQGQAFFLKLVPCKSISTVRFSKVSFSDIRC